MALLDFRKKAKEKVEEATEIDEELPEELEKFRSRARFGPPAEKEEPFIPEEYRNDIGEKAPAKKENVIELSKEHAAIEHKIDLILSKLETIDARLKLLEEKLKRFS